MTARTRYIWLSPRGVGLVCGLALMMILPARSAPPFGRPFWEQKVGPFYSRVVLWDAADLTERNLRPFYRQLSQELRGYRAWTVRVFVDEGDATRELHGKLATEKGYDWWLDLYNSYGRHPASHG